MKGSSPRVAIKGQRSGTGFQYETARRALGDRHGRNPFSADNYSKSCHCQRYKVSRQETRVVLSEHIKAGGATVFAHACKLGCEGIVSKRIDAPYRSGRARTWIKVRNKKAPAYTRIEDGTF